MIAEALGETIDIHGGGLDLQFPHHENELAQSSCAHGGAELAQIWMHNGFLTMAGDTKMSKSLGNVVTVDALLRDGWAGDVLRLALISAQYRQPLDWSERLLGEARARWQRWSEAADDDGGLESGVAPDARVLAALADDLNTPAALEAMSGLASAVFASRGAERLRLRAVLAASARLLGFGRLSLKTLEGDSGWLEALLEDYRAARAARDFARADGLRDEALARGVQLVVTKEGVSWRRA
jgi:cysteinyl-tRNA synthetase